MATMAEEMLDTYTAGNTITDEAWGRVWSMEARHPGMEPDIEDGTVLIRSHLLDGSVFEYRTNYGVRDSAWWGVQTNDVAYKVPDLCPNHCCYAIRHLMSRPSP